MLKLFVIIIITAGCVFYFSVQQRRYAKARKFKSAAEMLHTIMVLQLLISVCIFLSNAPSVVYAITLMGKKGLFSHRAVLHIQQICEAGGRHELEQSWKVAYFEDRKQM